jgi:hypothetical protein
MITKMLQKFPSTNVDFVLVVVLMVLGIELRAIAPLELYLQSFCSSFVLQLESHTFAYASLGPQSSYFHLSSSGTTGMYHCTQF